MNIKYLVNSFIVLLFVVLSGYTSLFYPGSKFLYFIFSTLSCFLLISGIRKNAIFFDTFISIFFFFGFWFKFSLRISFFKSEFYEPTGLFLNSAESFDKVLSISSCAFLALLIASLFREKYLFTYRHKKSYGMNLEILYHKFKILIIPIFIIFVLIIAITNIQYGIYQKGEISKSTLPFYINGIYKWLLLFGFSSFVTLFLKLESSNFIFNRYKLIILPIFETFVSSVSLLSRGMILNLSAILFGLYSQLKFIINKIPFFFFVNLFFIFIALFSFSIYTVNTIREKRVNIFEMYGANSIVSIASNGINFDRAKPLIIDRWVGIEGVMAVSSSPDLGWNLFNDALSEKYNENVMGFYDRNLITSPYINTDFSKFHHVSLPGIIAFLFYPGSFIFLFVALFILSIFASFFELLAYNLSDSNLIFCSLVGQVIAYRFSNFGYVPAQSYLLFITILLNILVIFFLYKCADFCFEKLNIKI